jgi:hypothetical protein
MLFADNLGRSPTRSSIALCTRTVVEKLKFDAYTVERTFLCRRTVVRIVVGAPRESGLDGAGYLTVAVAIQIVLTDQMTLMQPREQAPRAFALGKQSSNQHASPDLPIASLASCLYEWLDVELGSRRDDRYLR